MLMEENCSSICKEKESLTRPELGMKERCRWREKGKREEGRECVREREREREGGRAREREGEREKEREGERERDENIIILNVFL